MTVVVNGREDFSLENFARVTRGGEGVSLGEAAVRRMEETRAAFLEFLESDRTQYIYGVTSKFGINGRVMIPPEEQSARARRPRRTMARSFGPGRLEDRVVRGIVFARLCNLVSGYSKVRPVVAARVAELLDGPMPSVPLDGQVAAGEVLPLGHVLRGLDRSDLEEGEGNALSNGAPCSAALLSDVVLEAHGRLQVAAAVVALSIEAYRAPLEAYDVLLDDLWGDRDEAAALTALRSFLDGASTEGRKRHQAPVSFRIAGRVLGQCHRAARLAEEVAETSLRAVTDNPVFDPPSDDHRLGRAFSTGGYHNGAVYPALNWLSCAWADLVVMAERQATALGWRDLSELPRDARIGFSWVLSSFVEEARAAAMPALIPAVVNDPQDDVCVPTFSSYRRVLRAGECLDNTLAALAIEASQGLFVIGRPPPPPLSRFVQQLRSIFPPLEGPSPRDIGSEAACLSDSFSRAALAGDLELV